MAEVKKVEVPDIGDFDDVPVIEVLVAAGDTVAEEDPLVTLESDKATMDVPAPFAGVVQDVKVSVGDKVAQGTLLLSIEIGAGENGASAASDTPARTATSEEPASPGAVDTATEAEAEAGSQDAPQPSAGPPPEGSAEADGAAPPYASPAVRRLAREKGVDLSTVQGSGRKGRITKEDLEQPSGAPAAAALRRRAPASAPSASSSPGSRSSRARTWSRAGRRSRTSPSTTRPTSPTWRRSARASTRPRRTSRSRWSRCSSRRS